MIQINLYGQGEHKTVQTPSTSVVISSCKPHRDAQSPSPVALSGYTEHNLSTTVSAFLFWETQKRVPVFSELLSQTKCTSHTRVFFFVSSLACWYHKISHMNLGTTRLKSWLGRSEVPEQIELGLSSRITKHVVSILQLLARKKACFLKETML